MKKINIENLLENITNLANLGCPGCGGKFSTENCDHCDTYNEDAYKLSSAIKEELTTLQETIDNEQIILPADLIKICQIKNNHSINIFLEKNNIVETIKNNTVDKKQNN